MSQLVRLAYFSSARKPFTDKQLDFLLSSSRKSNSEHGITGIMLYSQGMFIQIMEGLESDINQLFLNIMDDSTHTGITRLYLDPIPKRDFTEWSMGFKRLSSVELEGFKDFFSPSSGTNYPPIIAETLLLCWA